MTTDWYPGGDRQPYYPRAFKVKDLAAMKLSGARYDFWLKARDKGLALWRGAAGFRCKPALVGYVPGFITLAVTDTHDGTAGQAWFGALPPDATTPAPGVGWAHVNADWFEQQFKSNISKELQRVIAHEVGHTLGFGHNPNVGLMNTAPGNDPSAEELAALSAYWHTA